MRQSVIRLCIKEGQNAVRFSGLGFCGLNANWEKDKMLSIFPFEFAIGKCENQIAAKPKRQACCNAQVAMNCIFHTCHGGSRLKNRELCTVAPLPSVANASA